MSSWNGEQHPNSKLEEVTRKQNRTENRGPFALPAVNVNETPKHFRLLRSVFDSKYSDGLLFHYLGVATRLHLQIDSMSDLRPIRRAA